MIASRRRAPESVRLLLNAKCSVDWADIHGLTALHEASLFREAESVSLLLAAGASATCQSLRGETPLHRLAGTTIRNCGDAKGIIELLVLAGTDLEARNLPGHTPMMMTLWGNDTNVMKCLLDLGCSSSSSNSSNENILHLAARKSPLESLEYLDSLGFYDINPYQKDFAGRTPRDLVLDAFDGLYFGIVAPSTTELSAFLNLCQGIKDRSLTHDIGNIEQVVAALQDRDAATARKYLGSLLSKEERWKRQDLVCWYRAVDKRIQTREWDLATEDLSDYLTELKEELGTPVYDIPSEYGCTYLDSRIWETTIYDSDLWESEASESEASGSEASE
ncbi:hypothetical protein LB507_009177 [Fusarium sp. FIESC RH6]|nr:hypothetical protein LB507_009177 [Fusarium sp. FIESC RH6]